MNNILVVNVNWLGDAVFSTPVFKALKTAYPKARISCLCVPRVKEVLEYCPYVDKILVYEEKGKHRWPWDKWRLIAALRREKFDAAFLLHRSMTRALIVYLAGIPLRIGYSKTKALLTHPVDMDPSQAHRSDFYLKVLEAYGLSAKDTVCELRVKEAQLGSLEGKFLKAGFSSRRRYVVLNTGGNWGLKRWPVDLFAALARRIHSEAGLTVVFSGSPKDRAQCSCIAEKAGIHALNLAGETTLGESLALYKEAVCVISNDSGPLHLANSVGARVVGIFGPTRPEITGPRGIGAAHILLKDVGCNKAPCYHLTCSSNVCMQAVTVDDVFQAFQKICG